MRRRLVVEAPSNLDRAIETIVSKYHCTNQLYWSMGPNLRQRLRLDVIFGSHVKLDSSPGIPWMILGDTNQSVLESYSDSIAEVIVARMHKLASRDLTDESPEQLVQEGFCDPIRIFGKNEPHPLLKILQGRVRLIFSVSLVDGCIERCLFYEQNTRDMETWGDCPTAVGAGLPEDCTTIYQWVQSRISRGIRMETSDVTGWDFTVQDWDLGAEAEMRIQLAQLDGDSIEARIIRNRFYCLANSIMSLSDGRLLTQTAPGIQKSGSYITGSSNSRMRALNAELVGSNHSLCMGDDCLEEYVEDAKGAYLRLGKVLKVYEDVQPGESFEFCSHLVSAGDATLINWPKMVYRYASKSNPDCSETTQLLQKLPADILVRMHEFLSQREGAAKELFN